MKTKKLLILAIAFMMCLCLVFAASCKWDVDSDESTESTQSGITSDESLSASEEEEVEITLSETATVAEFENITLTPVVKGEGEAVWSSSAPEIATVDGGVVYGVKAGKATIKIAIGKAEATCEVTVTPTRYAHEIVLSSESVTMSKGKESTVKASVTFNGKPLETEGVTYVWKPVGNAADIATVTPNENGSSVKIKGIAVGAAQFDVTTTVRGYEVYERLTVNVIDNVVILDFTNDKLQVGDGLYTLGLTLGSDETSKLNVGTVNILVDGEQKGEAEITWTSASSAAVSVENGVIIAHKAGYTLISGECAYGGRTLTAKIGVTVTKGAKTLENVGMVIETAADTTIEIPEGVTGNVEKITVSGKTVYNGATEITDGSATIIENSMPSDAKDLGEGKTVVIETESIVYTMQADVYTLIIDTKEELDSWQEIACKEAVKAGLCPAEAIGQYMTGYFVLGADIAYNGNYTVFTAFDYYWRLGNVGINGVKYGDGEWNNSSSYGFKGVFDGKGHVIDGFAVSGRYNGFVVTLSDGTIQNIAFTNAKVSGDASLIARAGTGTIKNIYVGYAAIGGDASENTSTVFGTSNDTLRTVENLVVDVTYCNFGEEVKNVYLVGGGYGTIKNVAVIGEFTVNAGNKALITDVDVSEGSYIVRANSYKALFADETVKAALATLDNTFWTVTDTIVLPKSVIEIHKNDEITIANTETEINKNSSLTVKAAGKYYEVSLKSAVDGVVIEDGVLKVDNTATIGDEITIVVKSLVSGKISEYTLTVAKLKQSAELTERKTVDLNLSVENCALQVGDILLDLSEGSEYIGTNRIVVKYGEAVLYDGEGANEVALSAEALKGVFGEKRFIVTACGTEIDYELSLPVNIISKTIKTKADLDGWQEIASYVAVEANLCPADAFRQYMTGYFVLGADISYNATFVPFTPFSTYWSLGNQGVNGVKYGNGEWNHGTSYGFKGVFDGRGYNIDGMGIAGDLGGFIVTLADGIVKNISFTNASVSGSSSLVVKAGIGTIENIYVQYTAIANATETGTFFSSGSDNARSVKNCIIDVTDCTFESANNVKLIGADADHGGEIVVYDGVYVVGTYPSNITLKDRKADCCAIGAFGTYAELLADEIAAAKIAAFDTSVWAKNENLIIFKRLFDADNVAPTITNEEAEIIKGISIKLTSNAKYVRYSFDGEIEGVSVNGNILSVAEDVADDTEITVVVTSLINGKSANFTFTVKSAGGVYVIGTEIDMTEENVTVPANAGLGGLWDMSAQFVTEGSGEYVAGGKGGEIRFSQNEVNAAGMITLNSPITIKDGMNYIRVRMYVKTSSAETATIRWNKSNNGVHNEGNKDITIKANEWVNTYLEVSYFAVDGKIDGIKLGYVGQSISGIYIDDITIVTENYTLGDVIDVDGVTLGGVDGQFGLSTIWAREIIDSSDTITGYNGKVARFRNYNGSEYGDMYAHAANVTLNNPVTVKDGMNYVKLRFYVSYSAAESLNLRFYRSDRTKHEVEKDVWSDYEVGVATNGWVNVYLPVSKFAVGGKINGFKFGCFTHTGDNAEIYLDDITITDVMGTKVELKGAKVEYPSYGNQWRNGMMVENSVIELSGGQPFACARINFAQPYTVTTETKIILTIKVSASLNGGFVAVFKRGDEGDGKWQEYRNYSVDGYATVEYDLSKFTEDGELKGISFGLFGSQDIAVGTTLYIESISVM